MNRKHLYLILYDMIKSHRIAGSRVLSIMAENLAEETAEDIIKYVLQLIPIIIQSYVPIESVTDYNIKLFKALIALMESGKFTATSTKQMLINSLFSFCQSEEHRNMILEWFERVLLLNNAILWSRKSLLLRLSAKCQKIRLCLHLSNLTHLIFWARQRPIVRQ